MSGLENLSKRLDYFGGTKQQGRMNRDKLRTLRKTLLYSYQAATAVLADGRCFRCLINPDKLKEDYDQKIISIPFADIRVGFRTSDAEAEEDVYIEDRDELALLATIDGYLLSYLEITDTPEKDEYPAMAAYRQDRTIEGMEVINLTSGDVFKWKENGSYWLVTLRNLEETAYFRSEIRRCRHRININGTNYRVSLSGPTEGEIDWVTKAKMGSYNNLNYDATMYVTKNDETDAFFHRFTIVEIEGKPWEVQVVDRISIEGVLQIALKEYYQNSTEKEVEELDKSLEENSNELEVTRAKSVAAKIVGKENIYPYDIKTYKVENISGGTWSISNAKAKINKATDTEVTIEVMTSRSGEFDLIYTKNDEDITLHVTIDSL